MEKIVGFFGILAAIFCMPGCGGKTESGDPDVIFAISQELFPDSIEVNQILVPTSLNKVNGHIVVTSAKTDTVFYVYSLPEFQYLYGSVIRGEGPDDLPRSFWDLISSDGRYLIADPNYSGRARAYFPQRMDMERKSDLKYPKYCSLRAVFAGNEKALSMKLSSGDKSRYVLSAVWGDSLSAATDSIVLRTKRYSINMGPMRISTTVNGCHVATSGNAFALFYEGMPRVEFYELTGAGEIKGLAAHGDTLYTWKEEDIIKPNGIGRPKDQTEYYVEAQASGGHFYTFYRGLTQQQYEENPYVFIRVFDRQGRPVKSFRIDGTYELFAVDEPHGIIYAVDKSKDFDHIYTFKYGLEE